MKTLLVSRPALARFLLGVAMSMPGQQMLCSRAAIAADQSRLTGVSLQAGEKLLREATLALMLLDPNQSTRALDDYLQGKKLKEWERSNIIAGGLMIAVSAIFSIAVIQGKSKMVPAGNITFEQAQLSNESSLAAAYAMPGFMLTSGWLAGGTALDARARSAHAKARLIQAIQGDVKLYGDLLGRSQVERSELAKAFRDRLEQASEENPVSLVDVMADRNWISSTQELKLRKSQEVVRALARSTDTQSTKTPAQLRMQFKKQLSQVSRALRELTSGRSSLSSRQLQSLDDLIESIDQVQRSISLQ